MWYTLCFQDTPICLIDLNMCGPGAAVQRAEKIRAALLPV